MKRREWQILTDSQLQVGGVVGAEVMHTRKRKDPLSGLGGGLVLDGDWQHAQPFEECGFHHGIHSATALGYA